MEQLRQQVIAMQRRVNDLMDDHGHGVASQLKREIQALEDDLQVQKSIGSIEDRIKRIVNILQGDARHAQIMDVAHLEHFRQSFEGLRQAVRKLG